MLNFKNMFPLLYKVVKINIIIIILCPDNLRVQKLSNYLDHTNAFDVFPIENIILQFS